MATLVSPCPSWGIMIGHQSAGRIIQEGKLKEYLQDSSEVLEAVGSDGKCGLTAGEAAARLERDGLNKLKEAEKDRKSVV